jgi:hypothetical protein
MDKELAYELYGLYRGEMVELFKIHREGLQHYLAFATAILGATIVGILQIQGMGWIGAVIAAGPILNVFVCVLAIRMCNRFYLGALERIAITAKLESVLGLQKRAKAANTDQDNTTEFPKDEYFLPERWLTGRKYDTSEEFVQQGLKKGVNRVARWTFYLLIAVNVLLGIAVIFIAFL